MSNKFASLLFAATMLSSLALAQATAPAASAGGTKIGIINMQAAIANTNEGQRDLEALSKKFEPKTAELKGLNDELESLKKQLDTQGSKLNDEARADLVKKIEAKQKALTRAGEDAQSDYSTQTNEIAQKIVQKMAPVIDKFAKTNGFGIVLDSTRPWPDGELIWATPSVSLTQAVVEAYNAQSDVPAPAKPAAPKPAAPKPAAPKPTAPSN